MVDVESMMTRSMSRRCLRFSMLFSNTIVRVIERVIESRVRNIVKIDEMQLGFMSGKGTTDAIFIVHQLQEKYLAKKKKL